jgi:ABC-type glycerol-3-phosphate transport system substrate-binding protein
MKKVAAHILVGLMTLFLVGCSSMLQNYGAETISGDSNSVTLNWWGSMSGDRNLSDAADNYCKKFKKIGKYNHNESKYRVVYDCVMPQPKEMKK